MTLQFYEGRFENTIANGIVPDKQNILHFGINDIMQFTDYEELIVPTAESHRKSTQLVHGTMVHTWRGDHFYRPTWLFGLCTITINLPHNPLLAEMRWESTVE